MKSERIKTPNISSKPYYIGIAAFLASMALLLLTVVDIRRGFLFPPNYFKVGTPSVLLNLNPGHLALLLIGGLGVWLAFRYLKGFESSPRGRVLNLKTPAMVMSIFIGVLIIIDLFIYRGVPASRTLEAGKMSAGAGIMGQGLAIPIASLPVWLQPAGDGINYLLIVWHATVLGVLLGGLFLVAAGTGLVDRLKGRGFGTHLIGVAAALPTPFCSCCAAPIGGAMYRKGASLGPVLAFTIAAPMLNITTLILAAALLPPEFALLRIAGGIIVAVFLTYFVSFIASKWVTDEETGVKHDKLVSWSAKFMTAYTRLFHFEDLLVAESPSSSTSLISNWMGMAGKLAKVVVPIFFVTAPVTAYIVRFMPDTANNLLGVAITSFFATLLMSPTWSEIAFAGGMIAKGFPALAAVSLITLPAVSVPCLLIISGAIGKMRIAIITGLAVFLTGIAAGIIFL
ncbi:MAG: permease [Dehalococcoidales bacterium]|nr:permease [Dehalococcoidales bacterium]